MVVAVLDVGSHTMRTLVASGGARDLALLHEERAQLGLGAEIERRGRLSKAKLAETARHAAAQARSAERLGAERLAVVVTAPGRQAANAERLVEALRDATGVVPRLLSSEEEGCFAFHGALAGAGSVPETVAVCDVGGGSTELVVGTASGEPAWLGCFELGAARLTARLIRDDPPGRAALEAVRAHVEASLQGFTPPLPMAALAAGGTARALRKLVGGSLGPDELAEAVRICRKRSSDRIAKSFGVDCERARTLAAGSVILAAIQTRLFLPFQVARFGLREGVALSLFAEMEEAAAA
jgi:exopolyphosphatase/guanosine-5'-triphosphate,3'-diphosphate pyrophosphatase